MTQKYLMLVMANATDNNNKFYELKLEDDGSVIARYGRVGVEGKIENKGQGEHTFETVARQKRAKGYKPVDIALAVKDEKGKTQHSLAEVAKRDLIANDPTLSMLIERLAAINAHQLMAATGGQITIQNGQVRTPVGLVTLASVHTAKQVLVKLQQMVDKRKTALAPYNESLEQYLTLVPQKVPHMRGWGPTFFTDHTSFIRQNDLLEQLESSLKTLEDEAKTAVPDEQEEKPLERMFGYSIRAVSDKKLFERINKIYKSQINPMHASSRLKLKNVYELVNDDISRRYDVMSKKVGNARELWHGTRACNVLSILKGGLIIPRSGGNFTITGRMFGDGLYFSDQSSKSLNYAYGYWGHGPKDNNCFMFLCDVAMGKEYIPSSSGNGQKSGYDSCFAKAGKSGVLNNEMIVYHLDQARPRYLCEFEA